MRNPLRSLVPVVLQAGDVRPEPHREPGAVGGSQRNRLGHDRPRRGHADDVGQKLHQEVVRGHPAVDLQLREIAAVVGIHRIDHLACLPGGGLEHRAREMTLVDVAGQSRDHTASIASPMRGEQPRESGDEVTATVVLDRERQRLDLRGAAYQADVVAEPLDERASVRDGALEPVHRSRGVELVRERGEQAAVGDDWAGAGVQHEEAPRAERALGFARLEAGLPDEGGVLVPERRGDGKARERRTRLAVHLRGRPDLRKHRCGHPDHVEQVQQRPARVRHVRDVTTAHVPDQPRIHRAEQDLAILGPFTQAGDVIQQPADLGTREVSGDRQPGLLTEAVLSELPRQLPTDAVGARVLPVYGVVHRRSRPAIPQHGRLPLVGDSERTQVSSRKLGLLQRHADDRQHVPPDLLRVVLHPTGSREVLAMLLLRHRHDPCPVVEDEAPRRGRSLVNRRYVASIHV